MLVEGSCGNIYHHIDTAFLNLAQSSTFRPASGCLFCLLLNTWVFRNVQSFLQCGKQTSRWQLDLWPFTQVFWCPTNSMDIPGCQLQARGLTGNSEALGNRGILKRKKKKQTCLGHLLSLQWQGMECLWVLFLDGKSESVGCSLSQLGSSIEMLFLKVFSEH